MKPATARRGAGPQLLFEIEPWQPVGVLFGDFALLDLLAIGDNAERRETLCLAPPAAQTSAVSDSIVAAVLSQVPDGPFLDQNVTPYRP